MTEPAPAAGSEEQLVEWLRALKRERGDELRRKYGAHAVGVGRRSSDGRPALLLYVEAEPAEWPGEVEFTPPEHGEPVLLVAEVVVSVPPADEAERG